MIGAWGIAFVLQSRRKRDHRMFVDEREQWPYLFAFAGLLLTAFGSSYYHLAPDNARLVWDRLPMTITFMSMVSAVIAERISVRLGIWLLPVLLVIGPASVLQWYWSETKGSGDLRFYAAVQAYSALVILMALLFPRRYTRTGDFGLVIGFYALAKGLELLDKPIFGAAHAVSGHTLKHLAICSSRLLHIANVTDAGTHPNCILRALHGGAIRRDRMRLLGNFSTLIAPQAI